MAHMDHNEWRLENLRATCFIDSPLPLPPDGGWEEAVGAAPESVTTRPGQGQIEATSSIGFGLLALQVQPGRVDWTLGPAAQTMLDAVAENRPLPGLGAFDSASAPFLEIVSHWLDSQANIRRLALGVVVHLPIESRNHGYDKLRELLPGIVPDADSASDFMYQVNRRRHVSTKSSNSTLAINRLSRWSVMQVRWGIVSDLTGAAAPNYSACRAELDLNTVPESELSLSGAECQTLLTTLAQYARELLSNGPIP